MKYLKTKIKIFFNNSATQFSVAPVYRKNFEIHNNQSHKRKAGATQPRSEVNITSKVKYILCFRTAVS